MLGTAPDLPSELCPLRDAAIEHILRGVPLPDLEPLYEWLLAEVNWVEGEFDFRISISNTEFEDGVVCDWLGLDWENDTITDAMRVSYVRSALPKLQESGKFFDDDSLHTYVLSNPVGESVLVGCIFDPHQWFHDPGIFATKEDFFEAALGDYYWLLSPDKPLTDEEILKLWWSDNERDGTVPSAVD
jgi:hypothetical protein